MAQRRMFSVNIINSARFLRMPEGSQSLYFHLALRADDDGVVEAYPILKMLGSAEDNLKVLVAKSFIKVLNEDLVAYITDWKEHNLIRADRKVDSIYKDLLVQVVPEVELIEAKPRADTGKTSGRPLDNQMTAQVRLGKDSIGKENIKKMFPFLKKNGDEEDSPLTLQEFKASCEASGERCYQIIGAYAVATKPDIRTVNQWVSYIETNLEAAHKLAPFDEEQIANAYARVKEAGWLKKYTLETLSKFLS